MAGPSAVLFNHETNTYEDVPAEQVGAAIASGQYTAAGTSTSTQADGGVVTRPVEQMGAAATQGEREAGGVNAARAAGARRDVQMGLVSDKALSFSEGVVDALSLGLIHRTGEGDELRREADSGSALMGQLLGTVLGLKLPGPIRGLTAGGEALGEGLARALLGEAETGFRGVVTRGLEEAGANAALMAASALGHQVTDAVLADKPFAAESIASEAGIGALMGFGAGFAGSAFGQLAKASRGAVEASGIAAKESRAALDAVHDLTRSWDDAVEQHAQRVGVLKVLADDGHIPGDMHLERSGALREAETARDALRELDPVRSLGGDPGEFQKWRGAVERYQDAVAALDEKMTPGVVERASANPVKLGESPHNAGPQIHPLDVDADQAAKGFQSPMASGLDAAMSSEARAAYEKIYGRPYENMASAGGGVEGEENLGGRETPTSDLGTNPGTRGKRRSVPVEASGEQGSTTPAADTVVDARVDRFSKQPTKYRTPRDTVIDAEGQTVLPREVLEAGERPASAAETGRDFVDSTKRRLELPPGEGEPVPEKPKTGAGEGKRAVRDYLHDWFREFDSKPRVNLGDQLQARLKEALDNIARASGSRLDSAGGLALLKSLGLKEATSPLGSRLDQVWSLGQAGKFAADEARGIKTPLRKGLAAALERYAVRGIGRAVGGAALGGAMGGTAGAILGMALTSAGFAGAAASTAGKLMQQISAVGEALLKGRRATIAVRAAVGNRPYQYSDEEPIKDPVQRIMEVQRLAANPDAIKARVARQMGDLALTSPEMAQHLADTTVAHVVAIAQSGPAILMTPLGKPIQPTGTALNRFYDFENAMHDLPGLLKAIANGTATESQIRALHIGYPAVHTELVRGVLGRPASLEHLEESKLKAMEKVLGYPLTRSSSDPTVTARFQGNWEAPKPAPQPAQAFKITAPKRTPAQAASGDRAPGNERKP